MSAETVRVTHFNYISGPSAQVNRSGAAPGGYVVYLKATTAIPLGYVVAIDTANDLQVVVAPANADTVIGVCIGYSDARGDHFTSGPAAGQIAIIQTHGIVKCIADSTITRGDRLKPGSVTPGRVATASAMTVSINSGSTTVTSTAANGNITTVNGDGATQYHIFGRALQSATAGATVLVLMGS